MKVYQYELAHSYPLVSCTGVLVVGPEAWPQIARVTPGQPGLVGH